MRVILRDLSEAWKSVADISFSVQSLASEPQLLYVIAPGEAVIVIAFEVRIGSTSGLMNLAIPSIFIKRLRHKFDQLQRIKKAESTENDQVHVAKLLEDATLTFQAEIEGGKIASRTLFNLEVDEIVILDHAVGRLVNGYLNGQEKWTGNVVLKDDQFAFVVKDLDKSSTRSTLRQLAPAST